MTAASLAFYASALASLGAGLFAVVARRSEHSLAAFAVAMLAAVIPLAQLGASAVAAGVVLAGASVFGLLSGVVGLVGGAGEPPAVAEPPVLERLRSRGVHWLLGGAGVSGLIWVLLATGSRQVVEIPSAGAARLPSEGAWLELATGGEWLWPTTVVGLLALCAVLAAVLSMVSPGASPGTPSR